MSQRCCHEREKNTGNIKNRRKVISIVIMCAMLTLLTAAAVVLYGRIATVASVEKVDEGFYKLTYKQDYNLDKAMQSNITCEEELYEFIGDELFFGFLPEISVEDYGCSTFLTQSPDGKYLAGRNPDSDRSDELILYTAPKDGYASMALMSLYNIGVDPTREDCYSPTGTLGKIAMLAAPYVCSDGINEKGLSVSFLSIDMKKNFQETGKPDISIPIAIRLLLDRAANVDEAVDLLEQYDMKSWVFYTQHLFIADASGRSVVVEWHKNQLYVTESPICTNFRLSSKTASENPLEHCERFDYIYHQLEESPKNTSEDSMRILEAVSQDYEPFITQWSCVYNLSDFSVRNCEEINFQFMLRIICFEQGKFSQEYFRISRKFNAVQGKLDKQK